MSRGKKIICNETGIIYDSISDAERKLNYSSGKLSKYVKSGDSIDNMTFSYYVEEEAPKAEKKAPAKKAAAPKKETAKPAAKKTTAKKEEKAE